MVVPRLGVELELQLPAYTPATTSNLSHICDLHRSSQQGRILNPLSKARDQTHVLMDISQRLIPLSHSGNSQKKDFKGWDHGSPALHARSTQSAGHGY